jgi:hypothetical protein
MKSTTHGSFALCNIKVNVEEESEKKNWWSMMVGLEY